MTHEEYTKVTNLAKKITQYEVGDNEAIIIFAASEKEDSLVNAHNGDGSIIVPMLKNNLLKIIRNADEDNKKAYIQSLLNDILKILEEATRNEAGKLKS